MELALAMHLDDEMSRPREEAVKIGKTVIVSIATVARASSRQAGRCKQISLLVSLSENNIALTSIKLIQINVLPKTLALS